ncbi:MAG: DUF3047 domain-containing protein [Gemmatimonadota bacterium]|nr:DUF3047 domain-containing protein [Gemmatimonadota bacterium]
MSWLAILLAMVQFVGSLDLLGLSAAPPGSDLPPGWKIRLVRGQSAPMTEVLRDDGVSAFRLSGAGRAAWYYRELSPELVESSGVLEWSWRVTEAPPAADLRATETDDSPIRVYVVFGKPGIFNRAGRIIFYTFGNGEPGDYSQPSHASDKMQVIRVDGADARRVWRDHKVDPFADYRRIWHRDPPPITAIGVMQDTDQTGERAVAELRRLEWRTP